MPYIAKKCCCDETPCGFYSAPRFDIDLTCFACASKSRVARGTVGSTVYSNVSLYKNRYYIFTGATNNPRTIQCTPITQVGSMSLSAKGSGASAGFVWGKEASVMLPMLNANSDGLEMRQISVRLEVAQRYTPCNDPHDTDEFYYDFGDIASGRIAINLISTQDKSDALAVNTYADFNAVEPNHFGKVVMPNAVDDCKISPTHCVARKVTTNTLHFVMGFSIDNPTIDNSKQISDNVSSFDCGNNFTAWISGGDLYGKVLGTGSQNNASVFAGATTFFASKPSGRTFVSVKCGHSFFAALDSSGELHLYGDNTYGQRTLPTNLNPATTNNNLPITQFELGHFHVVVKAQGSLPYAWGDNTYGQCTIPSGVNTVTNIFAGANCSMAQVGFSVYGFGNNSVGQCPPTNLGAGLGVNKIAFADTAALFNKSSGATKPLSTLGTGGYLPADIKNQNINTTFDCAQEVASSKNTFTAIKNGDWYVWQSPNNTVKFYESIGSCVVVNPALAMLHTGNSHEQPVDKGNWRAWQTGYIVDGVDPFGDRQSGSISFSLTESGYTTADLPLTAAAINTRYQNDCDNAIYITGTTFTGESSACYGVSCAPPAGCIECPADGCDVYFFSYPCPLRWDSANKCNSDICGDDEPYQGRLQSVFGWGSKQTPYYNNVMMSSGGVPFNYPFFGIVGYQAGANAYSYGIKWAACARGYNYSAGRCYDNSEVPCPYGAHYDSATNSYIPNTLPACACGYADRQGGITATAQTGTVNIVGGNSWGLPSLTLSSKVSLTAMNGFYNGCEAGTDCECCVTCGGGGGDIGFTNVFQSGQLYPCNCLGTLTS